MNFKEIQELIRLVSKSNLSEFKMSNETVDITIRTEAYSKGKTVVGQPMVQMAPAPAQSAPALVSSSATAPVADLSSAQDTGSEDTSNLLTIKSPIVGTFYRASGPDKPPFKKVGDKVAIGDTVSIVEAMKLFNEIESEVAGTIVQVLVEDASPIEYDQPLFLVKPN
jgi:acetyl-CoA carboxylase biotin carboxyl carrier protein